MSGITKEHLESIVARINDELGAPTEPHAEGRYKLDYAYGGSRLVRVSKSGGQKNITPRGTRYMLHVWCEAFLAGVDAARN